MRIYILLWVLLLTLPFGIAMEECQREQAPKDIPCVIISSYLPSGGCIETLYIYNGDGDLVQSQQWDLMNPFCNSTWNISLEGTYVYNSTIEDGVIVVKSEDEMASLGVVLFIILINIVMFLLPVFVRFNDSEAMNNMMKKIVWIGALVLLAFNTNIVVSIANNAGLGIDTHLFLYQRIFLWGIWVSLVFLFWNMIISTAKMWKLEKKKRTMGEE